MCLSFIKRNNFIIKSNRIMNVFIFQSNITSKNVKYHFDVTSKYHSKIHI
jgi:hypothetical protein